MTETKREGMIAAIAEDWVDGIDIKDYCKFYDFFINLLSRMIHQTLISWLVVEKTTTIGTCQSPPPLFPSLQHLYWDMEVWD